MIQTSVSQKLYDIRSEPFDDPNSDHHSVFFVDAGDDAFLVFEVPKRLTTVESPELILVFLPPGGSLSSSPLDRFKFFGVLGRSERSETSEGGSGSLLPFSHSRRCRRYIAIVALASVTRRSNAPLLGFVFRTLEP